MIPLNGFVGNTFWGYVLTAVMVGYAVLRFMNRGIGSNNKMPQTLRGDDVKYIGRWKGPDNFPLEIYPNGSGLYGAIPVTVRIETPEQVENPPLTERPRAIMEGGKILSLYGNGYFKAFAIYKEPTDLQGSRVMALDGQPYYDLDKAVPSEMWAPGRAGKN